MENQTKIKQNRITEAKKYLTKHNISFTENDTMTKLEKLVDENEKALRKQARQEKKQEINKQVIFEKINKDNLLKAIYNSKGTTENPYKVSSKFQMTLEEFENTLKTEHNDLFKIFKVHKENWLGTKINQPTISVPTLNFYKTEFNINENKEIISNVIEKDLFEDEEIN